MVAVLSIIEFFIPHCKYSQPFPDINGRLKSIIIFKPFTIGIGDRNVPGLHSDKLSVRFEIIICRQHPCVYKLFL